MAGRFGSSWLFYRRSLSLRIFPCRMSNPNGLFTSRCLRTPHTKSARTGDGLGAEASRGVQHPREKSDCPRCSRVVVSRPSSVVGRVTLWTARTPPVFDSPVANAPDFPIGQLKFVSTYSDGEIMNQARGRQSSSLRCPQAHRPSCCSRRTCGPW